MVSCELKSCLILQVDGTNLQGFTNQQAVDVLRHTGQTVRLTLIRRGFKQENHIQPQEDFSAPEKDLLFQTTDGSTVKGNLNWLCFRVGLTHFSSQLPTGNKMGQIHSG